MWFSLFTPQIGDEMDEILQPAQRAQAIADMLVLRKIFPKTGYAGGFDSPVCHTPA